MGFCVFFFKFIIHFVLWIKLRQTPCLHINEYFHSLFIPVFLFVLFGCASSIVEGEYIRTTTPYLEPKTPDTIIGIHFSDNPPTRKWRKIGKVISRAYILEKGIERLRQEARKLGADAIINVKYERELSVDYLQDLYFITGDGVVWNVSTQEGDKLANEMNDPNQAQHFAGQIDRLKSFLFHYCQTYESKDLDKFSALFTPDATENNRPFHLLLPKYRKNMDMIESINYRIDLLEYSSNTSTGNIMVKGKYFTRFMYEGTLKENSGNISMELIENG